MSPEKQRIAIAEACGWTDIKPEWVGDGGGDYKELCGVCPASINEDIVPDYLNDLNAMHEAEKVLTDVQMRGFGMELHAIVTDEMRADGCKTQEDFDARPKWTFHTTAAQRAEAFLRTLNLWEDS